MVFITLQKAVIKLSLSHNHTTEIGDRTKYFVPHADESRSDRTADVHTQNAPQAAKIFWVLPTTNLTD